MTVEEMAADMQTAVSRHKAEKYAGTLTRAVVMLSGRYNPGETILAFIYTLARVAASAKPEKHTDAEWLENVTKLLKGEYAAALIRLRREMMKCICGGKAEVTDSRLAVLRSGPTTKRRRLCERCGMKFTTYELIQKESISWPRNRSGQPLSRS